MFTEKMNMAFRLASESHAKQKRKGTNTPYIAHPMAVASLVLEHGGSEDAFCSAMLHDVIEDCHVEESLIFNIFGQHVLDTVKAVTNPPIDWKSFKNDEELQKKLMGFRMAMFEKIRDAEADVQLVSASDKLHNARGILVDLQNAYTESGGTTPATPAVVAVWNRFRGKRAGTLWYYTELSQVYCDSKSAQVQRLGRELKRVCEEMNRLF